LVYGELQRIASQSEPSELTRFPVLRDRMLEVVSNLLRRCVNPTQLMVSNLVKIELAYINTSHPDFIGGSKAVARLMTANSVSHSNTKENDRAAKSKTKEVRGPVSPLSPTSLNNYTYADAREVNEDHPGRQGKDEGGIMDFIFRGDKAPPHHGGAAMNMNNKPSEHNGNGASGPPAIVHLPQVPQTMKQTDVPPNERERVEMEVIKSLLSSYFEIVQKNYTDLVPKTIMYFLVNHVRDSLQNELVSELYRDAEVGNLMQEAEDIAERRQNCTEMKDLLSKALEIVNEVRDFNTFK
jgi:dynamin 1-like protein